MSIEKEWTTHAGLRAKVVNDRHRCGYVEVPETHPLYGAAYSEPHPALQRLPEDTPIGKRGILVIFCAARDPDATRRPDVQFNVHGGITFAGKLKGDAGWWFGYDCAHADDTPEICTLEYCISECESLAEQLGAVKHPEVTP